VRDLDFHFIHRGFATCLRTLPAKVQVLASLDLPLLSAGRLVVVVAVAVSVSVSVSGNTKRSFVGNTVF
jgi:hypothetical protein